MFTERIVKLEEENIQLADKNSKLEESIDNSSNSVRTLQEEKLKQDEVVNNLMIDNKNLKAHVETFKKNELEFEELQSENKNLKKKLSSMLNILLLDDSLIDDRSRNTS